MKESWFVLLLILLLPLPGNARDLRVDPATGRVRVIYMGKVGWEGPFPVMELDPLIYGTAVYTSTILYEMEIIKRSLRAYMPRTYSRLLNHDVIVLADAFKDVFKPEHFTWMHDAVVGEGLGLVMIGGAESFTGKRGSYPSWRPTVVADVLPCEMVDEGVPLGGGRLRVTNWENEFIASLPFNTLGPWGQWPESNYFVPRQESEVLANLVRGLGKEDACLNWWDVGAGRTLAQSVSWQMAGGVNFMRWSYYGDYAINMMLFLAGQSLPEDIETVHLLRRRMREAEEGIHTLVKMIDLIERFGGNSIQAGPVLADLQASREDAKGLYLEARIEDSISAYDGVMEAITEAMDLVIVMRNRSAFWIFLTEWCIVTGTFVFAGAVVWSLMIRRRLYREVSVTRQMAGE